MSNKPLLSICIPTYNRSSYLEKTLDSIINQNGFDNRVEIIISDNCSTDDTRDLCLKYSEKFHNIKYFCNDSNLADRNFALALSRGTGILRKLINDTLLFNGFTLEYFLELIDKEKEERRPIFNHYLQNKDFCCVDNLDKFLSLVSFNVTWIGSVSVWEDDIDLLFKNEYSFEKKLWQVPFVFDCIKRHESCIVITKKLFETQTVEKKDISYGIYEIFYNNFLGILKTEVDLKFIKQDTFEFIEKDLLFNFFSIWMYNYEVKKSKFLYSESENIIDMVLNTYRKKKYYSQYVVYYFLYKLKNNIRAFLSTIKKRICNVRFR